MSYMHIPIYVSTSFRDLSSHSESSRNGIVEPNTTSNASIETIDPEEPGAYEKIRQRNIEERKKKFEEFKLANLVSKVSKHVKKKPMCKKKLHIRIIEGFFNIYI